jgi:hypothetical protein
MNGTKPPKIMRLPSKGMSVHVLLQARVGHDLGDDLVARGLVLVDDPREHHGLVVGRLDRAGERGQFAVGHVVAEAFDVGQRAVFHPDLAASWAIFL